ncbi:MAG: class I SAM-dependent methyltransferase [Oscillospiraceae bacterium]|nr:class I SAM-dependent methyltransferase [Oscillospiraceae bacterium]
MSFVSLPSRLLAIAALVPRGSLVADIGTDHALLPIYLIENGITDRVIASDIVDGPLSSAKKNISAHGLEDEISIIKSDGIAKVYPFTPKTIIIAGMGGETIRDIISACDYSVSGAPYFILQPMTRPELLREYLIKNGFSILSETVIQEQHHFYVIISAQYKQEQEHYFKRYDISESLIYELGGITPQSSSAAVNYLLWRKETALRAREGLLKSQSSAERAEEFSALVCEIDRRLSIK